VLLKIKKDTCIFVLSCDGMRHLCVQDIKSEPFFLPDYGWVGWWWCFTASLS